MGYAFISYSTKNQSAADAMRELLKKHNIDTWMAPYDIPGGSEYVDVLHDALIGCSCLILMLTNFSQNSPWVKKEVNLAISNGKPIIPIKLEDVELNSTMTVYLTDWQIVPVRVIDETSPEIQSILNKIISLVGKTGNKEQTRTSASSITETVKQEPLIVNYGGHLLLNGRYGLGQTIGVGGFGTTYKAWDRQNHQPVAVKIGASYSTKTTNLHRFLINKAHDNLCSIYDAVSTPESGSYIIMEWFDRGIPLSFIGDGRNFYKQFADVPAGSHILVLIDVLAGLKQLHSYGIVHNDIQPSNILTDGCATKLIDYSSSYFLNDGNNHDIGHSIIINLSFNSPEDIKDFRSDLYSVGMVAFKWLTGKSPKVNEEGHLIFDDICIDDEAKSILKKATAPLPADRYQTADEFILALKKYLVHST